MRDYASALGGLRGVRLSKLGVLKKGALSREDRRQDVKPITRLAVEGCEFHQNYRSVEVVTKHNISSTWTVPFGKM